jgi:hypothetical protein
MHGAERRVAIVRARRGSKSEQERLLGGGRHGRRRDAMGEDVYAQGAWWRR